MIRSGRLDRTVVIQSATVAQDSIGAEKKTWSTLATVPAEYIPVGGSEAIAGNILQSQKTARFIIRYRSDVTVKNRLTFESDTWDISYLREIGRREGLEITAQVVK